MTVEFIAGPPGTGKTTALLERFERELAAGTPADRIGFVTFTRAARHEALDRASRKFNLSDDDLPWVRTVHGAAYKRLGHEAAKLLSPALWREFATKYQYHFTPVGPGHVEDGGSALPRQTADDRVRSAYEWGRNRRLTIAETLARTSAVVEPRQSEACSRGLRGRCWLLTVLNDTERVTNDGRVSHARNIGGAQLPQTRTAEQSA